MWWARLLNTVAGYLSGGVAADPNAYVSIATTTVGSGGASTITFSSIPATYTHLQIRIMGAGSNTGDMKLRFNGDTGSNYARHGLYGTGASALAYGLATQAFTVVSYMDDTSYPGAAVIDILDYANTNKYKTVKSLTGQDKNGSGQVSFRSGLWQNTSAVTQIDLVAEINSYTQYSSFALYGIKGA